MTGRDASPSGPGDRGPPRGEDGDAFRGPLLVDAHVHLYDCFERAVFFDGALENFRAAARALGLAVQPAGCLMFTEAAGYHYFRGFRAEAGSGGEGGAWSFVRTGEDCSLIAKRNTGEEILVVAGRQIATEERLEVLALGSEEEVPDGRAIRPTLDAVLDSGAIAVLPWGFGKWWFGRGVLMAEVVRSLDPTQVFLGDNGGRPQVSPRPRLFRLAESRHIKILPGTDPLPFPSEAAKAGGYGFVLEGRVARDRPGASLKDLLRRQKTQPALYGRLEGLGRFCRNQILMRVRRHA